MKALFIDTWGWINIFNRKERHHRQVSQLYQEFRQEQGTITTTDYILDETYTLLFKRIPVEMAQKALETISDEVEKKYVNLIRITPERFEAAQYLRIKFLDKPNISFTGLTSMVVMREFGITEVTTGDAHFSHVGIGFVLLP